MRIRRVELSGFKSFMERTAIDLPDGVTAIVGPNGCGKSNVVDGIRWVLGEQSPKHLRGTSMEDVIFAGNSQQGPLGMAEVSLLLERSEEDLVRARSDEAELAVRDASALPAELSQASEILVTRRYFRSGESEYFINRAPCRLRDITELFLGTGVGTKAYAIIEQGRVEQLVSAKPDELRLFIEEAAGTTRYRARKLSAERKMARTRENLVRVQDVLREQQRQIASLERQARLAEEYHRLKEELRDLDFRTADAQHRMLGERQHGLAVCLGIVRSGLRRMEREVAGLKVTSSEARHARAAAEARLRDVEARHTAAQVAAADGDVRLEALTDRRRDVTERASAAAQQRGVLGRTEAQLCRDAAAAERDLQEARAAAEDAARNEAEIERRLAMIRASQTELEGAVEDAKSALVDAIGEETRLRNMDEVLQARRDDLLGQRRRLEEEQRLLGERLDANQRARDRTHASLAGNAGQIEATEHEFQRLAERRPELAGLLEERGEELEASRRAATQIQSRIESLEDLQRRAEGCTRGASNLLGAGGSTRVLLADVLRVPESLERAVAVALRTRLGDVVVEGTRDAVEAVRWLLTTDGGSATVLPRGPERRATTIIPAGPRLLDEIEVDPTDWSLAESLLGDVMLSDDLDAALALWRASVHPVTVVTRAGELIDALGAVTGGSEAPLEEALLARHRTLRRLRGEFEEVLSVVRAREAAVEVARTEVMETDREIARLRELRQSLQLARVTAENDRDRLEEERARLTAELEVSALEVSGVIGAGGQLAGELEGLSAARRRATDGVAQRRSAVAEAVGLLAEWRDRLVAEEQEHTTVVVTRAAMAERIRASESVCASKRASLDDLRSRLADLAHVEEEAMSQGSALDEDLQSTSSLAAEAHRQVAALGVERESLVREMTALNSGLEADDERERALRDELECRRTRKGEWDVQVTELQLSIDAVDARLRERYDVTLAMLSEEPRREALGPQDHERADVLRTRLVRLGDVNPGAVGELESVRERFEFVASQRRDLERSLADLEHTIESLNRTCRLRFHETFAAANERLAEVFPKLFPGGKARLHLLEASTGEDGDERAEPGVEIVVQPAGKKLQSLSLLSGGEKALTATALVFSLFLIRPTPFCLLDEVDAPLDEANIGRFNQMIHDMAAKSQFLVVTHNRQTMEGAATLYGITMEQAGVSKVVSVRLHEAA